MVFLIYNIDVIFLNMEALYRTLNPNTLYPRKKCPYYKYKYSRCAEELERRSVVEEEKTQEMMEALRAAEEEASLRVEDGYKEAALAVETAM
jgi:hypothetical protein